MDWKSDWAAIRDRIAGVERAAELFMQGLGVRGEDPYEVRRKVFRHEFQAITAALLAFRRQHASTLPVSAQETLDRFETVHANLLRDEHLNNIGHTLACVTILAGVRAELAYQLADRAASQLRLTERALQHLQRQIVADAEIGSKWSRAFASGEVACEKLGAAHLLSHGIWAFKVSGEGERTDLVFSEPVDAAEVSSSGADALVLTEWKAAESPTDAIAKAESGLQQIRRYSSGVLGGVELAESRYVVVVSKDYLPLPADALEGGTMIRYRGIAVAPSTPSRSSRRRAS